MYLTRISSAKLLGDVFPKQQDCFRNVYFYLFLKRFKGVVVTCTFLALVWYFLIGFSYYLTGKFERFPETCDVIVSFCGRQRKNYILDLLLAHQSSLLKF